MTEQAEAWSVAASGRRREAPARVLPVGRHPGRTARPAASSLLREQRFSAGVSHELRTPLARVIAEAQLALRHPRSAQ
jgi:signal transduction histidine kinase